MSSNLQTYAVPNLIHYKKENTREMETQIERKARASVTTIPVHPVDVTRLRNILASRDKLTAVRRKLTARIEEIDQVLIDEIEPELFELERRLVAGAHLR